MGKSTWNWIESLFLKKKLPSSKLSKGRRSERIPKTRVLTVSAKESVPTVNPSQGLVRLPPPISNDSAAPSVALATNVQVTEELNDAATLPCSKSDMKEGIDSHEKAAKTIQAAAKRYLARRSSKTLNCIVRLQALVRGHLVRRRAVATLRFVWIVVKLQALIRGDKTRRSNVLGECRNWKNKVSLGFHASPDPKDLPKHSLAKKLLVLPHKPSLLSLPCNELQPNPTLEWINCWSRTRFWACSLSRMIDDFESQAKLSDASRNKNSEGEVSRNPKLRPNGSLSSKSNQNMKESYISLTDEKTSERSRKVRSLTKVSTFADDSTEKSKTSSEASNKKASKSISFRSSKKRSTENAEESRGLISCYSDDSMNNINYAADALREPSDPNMQVEQSGHFHRTKADAKQGTRNKVLKKETHLSFLERISLRSNIDNQENSVEIMSKTPSYMAPTQSARAKLRAEGHSSSFQESGEKSINRRLSLPILTDGKINSCHYEE